MRSYASCVFLGASRTTWPGHAVSASSENAAIAAATTQGCSDAWKLRVRGRRKSRPSPSNSATATTARPAMSCVVCRNRTPGHSAAPTIQPPINAIAAARMSKLDSHETTDALLQLIPNAGIIATPAPLAAARSVDRLAGHVRLAFVEKTAGNTMSAGSSATESFAANSQRCYRLACCNDAKWQRGRRRKLVRRHRVAVCSMLGCDVGFDSRVMSSARAPRPRANLSKSLRDPANEGPRIAAS